MNSSEIICIFVQRTFARCSLTQHLFFFLFNLFSSAEEFSIQFSNFKLTNSLGMHYKFDCSIFCSAEMFISRHIRSKFVSNRLISYGYGFSSICFLYSLFSGIPIPRPTWSNNSKRVSSSCIIQFSTEQ